MGEGENFWYLASTNAASCFINTLLSLNTKKHLENGLESSRIKYLTKKIIMENMEDYIKVGLETSFQKRADNFSIDSIYLQIYYRKSH